MHTFTSSIALPYPVEAVFSWHEHPGALDTLLPAFPKVRVVQHEGIHNGATASLSIQAGPIRLHWEALHRDYIRNHQFRDVQIRGPFRRWEHTHSFEPLGDHACRMTDQVLFELRGGRIMNFLLAPLIGLMLHGMFLRRHRALEHALREAYAWKPCEI